jgi:hypothetical protein
MSRPTRQQLLDWRVFLESAFALIDILDAELQSERKLTLVWYDALVHLEDAIEGLGMTELANRRLKTNRPEAPYWYPRRHRTCRAGAGSVHEKIAWLV